MENILSVIMLLVGGAAGFGIAVFIHKTNVQNQISRLNAEWQLKIESVRAEHKAPPRGRAVGVDDGLACAGGRIEDD